MSELAGMALYGKCVKLIKGNYNKYFKNSNLVEDILAEAYNIPLSYIVNSKRLDHDPFTEEKSVLRRRIRYVLHGLEKDGYVDKWSRNVWRKVGF